jgi:hypothetical protein
MFTARRYGPPLALLAGGVGLIFADVAFGLAWLMIVAAIVLIALAITGTPNDRQPKFTDVRSDRHALVASTDAMPPPQIVVFNASADRRCVMAAQADLVVLRCSDGTWIVSKDRDGGALSPRPWDDLPARLKDAIGSVMV